MACCGGLVAAARGRCPLLGDLLWGEGLLAFFFFLGGRDMGAGYDPLFARSCRLIVWVLTKFRHYLSAEASLERELHIERLKEEIDTLKANNKPQA